jgi:acetyltransferase-like isoleucine patch superfamily enzyme
VCRPLRNEAPEARTIQLLMMLKRLIRAITPNWLVRLADRTFVKLFLRNHEFIAMRIEDVVLHRPRFYCTPEQRARISISPEANINNALFNSASGDIVVEDFVFFGHNVSVIAATHDYSKIDRERMTSIPTVGRDITIQRGAWIGSNSTILGPCVIGEHAVVAAGSVVKDDVPAYHLVGGVPARAIREIGTRDQAG